ncbi:MAG: Ig-like domain-containing protein [Polyangiales bacterium]
MAAATGCSEHTTARPREVAARTSAVFDNGGFESDSQNDPPTGWTVTAYLNGRVTLQDPQSRSGLNLNPNGGKLGTRVIEGLTPESQTDPNAPNLRFPKYGTASAVINYAPPAVPGNSQNANSLKQQLTIDSGDVDPDDNKIHVRFVLAAVLENPQHDVSEQPYYFVQVRNTTRNALLYQDFQISNQPGVPWQPANNNRLWLDWKLVDVSPAAAELAIGDVIEVEIIAAGCSHQAHFGRVYVDAFGAQLPGLFTSATAPATVAAGGDLTYTVHYKNGSASTTNDTIVEFVTPPNTTFRSVSRGGCSSPPTDGTGTVSCNLGNLAAGAQNNFEITVRVDEDATGRITQGNYLIRADGVSPLHGSKVVTTIPGPVLVVNVRSGLDRIGWNDPITYTITVANSGSAAANGVEVDDIMPSQLVNETWTCVGTGGGTCAASGTGNIADTVNLPVGALITYTLTAAIQAGAGNGSTTHEATASYAVPSPGTGTIIASANETLEIRELSGIMLTKTAAGSVNANTNGLSCGTGCTSATGRFTQNNTVILTATPPVGGRFVGWTGAGSPCSGSNPLCTITVGGSNVSVRAEFVAPTITAVAGTPQTTATGTEFATDLTVEVRDPDNNNPVNNAPVLFTAPQSGASAVLDVYSRTTGSDGRATIPARANTNPGTYNITASLAGSDTNATFRLTNRGAPALITVVSGGDQDVPVGKAAGAPIVVRVTDAAGTPLDNVAVTFTAPSSGASGTITTTPITTGADGQASTPLTANTTTGSYVITAAVSGIPNTTIATSNVAGPPATLELVPGSSPQSAKIGTAFMRPLRVRVLDEYGNPVPGANVSFTTPDSGPGASLDRGSAPSGADGQAGVTATANQQGGSYQVTARLPGDITAVFELNNTVDAPVTVGIRQGGTQHGLATREFDDPIEIEVTDAEGEPVRNRRVTVTVTPGSADATPSTIEVTTDDSGRASVILTAGPNPGTFTLQISADGGAMPVTAELTVDPLPTETTLALSTTRANPGQPVQLTATVTSNFGTPTGKVRFVVDGEVIDEVDLDEGSATTSYTSPDAGTRRVVVEYPASGSYGDSSAEESLLEVGDGDEDGGPGATDAGRQPISTRGWRLSGGSGSCALTAPPTASGTTYTWLLVSGAALFLVRRRRRR